MSHSFPDRISWSQRKKPVFVHEDLEKLVLLIGRPGRRKIRPAGPRLADRPIGLIISFADFIDNFWFLAGILNSFLIN
jgi:hypothetical protein